MPMHEDHYDGGDGWVAGVDFDPSDPDEMEIMRVVWEKEKYDKLARLEREVELLRAALIAREQLQNALMECTQCHKHAVCIYIHAMWLCGSCANEVVENDE